MFSEYSQLGHSRVVLDNHKFSAGVVKDGSFVMWGITLAYKLAVSDAHTVRTYLLGYTCSLWFLMIIYSTKYVCYAVGFRNLTSLAQLRLDVTNESTVEVRPYVPGTPLNPPSSILLSHPIKLSAHQKFNYFIPRESFNIMGMLKSPMILIMIFGGGLVLGMPYLMVMLFVDLVSSPSYWPSSIEKHWPGSTWRDQEGAGKDIAGTKCCPEWGSQIWVSCRIWFQRVQYVLINHTRFSALMSAASGQDQSSSQPSPQNRAQTPNKSRGKGKRR